MEQLNTFIQNQYNRPDIFETIIERLKEQGVDLKKVSRNHLSEVDEIHVRGAEVSKELVKGI